MSTAAETVDGRSVDVVTPAGTKSGTVDLPADVFDVAGQHPADPPGRRGPARCRAPGHAQHQDPRRGPRRWPQAVQAEGHRPRPSGLDPRAAVRRRWRRARPAAARLRAADPEEDEGRRPARRPLRPGPRRPRARRRPAWSTGDDPVDQGRRRGARRASASASTCSWSLERDDEVSWKSCATSPTRAPARRRPAQHLRRARQRRRRVHRGRARRVPRRSRPRARVPRPSPASPRLRGGCAVTRSPTRATSCSRRSSPRRATACSTRTSTRSSSRPDANKTQIKIAVEQVFGVKVTRRQHAQPPGQAQAHPVRLRQAPDTKRAIVSLADGDRIDIFGGPVA